MTDRFTVDADFPGGNIIVDSMEGNTLHVRPDLRTTTPWWFYWYFRLTLASGKEIAGETIQVSFGDRRLLGPKGPCHSLDGGRTWTWLGRESVNDDGFHFTFPAGFSGTEVRFAVSFPYVTEHLHAFWRTHPDIERRTLDRSEHGRPIELLTLLSQRGTFVVPLTARLHACETMGSYTLEGILDGWLNDPSPEGEFLREHVDIRAIPFFDIDGVEAGDQGKQRAPHDHNRDFIDAPLYTATRALQRKLPAWRGKLALALDLHCPWITGGRNDELFLVGSPEPWATHEAVFTQILQDVQQGELRYDRRHTIPAGIEWNSGDSPTLTRYIRNHHDIPFAASFEIPYAIAGGQTMTPANTRAFGRDMARAIGRFVQSTMK